MYWGKEKSTESIKNEDYITIYKDRCLGYTETLFLIAHEKDIKNHEYNSVIT